MWQFQYNWSVIHLETSMIAKAWKRWCFRQLFWWSKDVAKMLDSLSCVISYGSFSIHNIWRKPLNTRNNYCFRIIVLFFYWFLNFMIHFSAEAVKKIVMNQETLQILGVIASHDMIHSGAALPCFYDLLKQKLEFRIHKSVFNLISFHFYKNFHSKF